MIPNKTLTAPAVPKKTSGLEQEYSDVTPDRGYDVDVLSQFKTNLQQVEDLNRRLRFVLVEVSSLIKRP